ncbi:50S ribosomal protein L13 [Candidatus Wolfebacteria bacterium]|nr:MAG: 50S ribosomal protein L13 [Candidatus Wolfebacteria bacterium]
MKTYTIDATGKKLGRIASEAAAILIGKNTTDFAKNTAPNVEVTVANASQLDISSKKADEKMYGRYSGYPGGLKFESLGKLSARKGYKAIVSKAVKGMLPKNKLQPIMLKNLIVTE